MERALSAFAHHACLYCLQRRRSWEDCPRERRRTRGRPSRDLGVEGAGPLLLSVGRLVAQRTTRRASAPCRRCCAPSRTPVLVIAGSGMLRADLERDVAALGLGSHVLLLGARTDVPRLLHAADVFVVPRYEGLGIALMEALAAGLPAVSSDIGTSREVADGSSAVRFFTRGDAGALAVVLVAALKELPSLQAAAAIECRDGRRSIQPGGHGARLPRSLRSRGTTCLARPHAAAD